MTSVHGTDHVSTNAVPTHVWLTVVLEVPSVTLRVTILYVAVLQVSLETHFMSADHVSIL